MIKQYKHPLSTHFYIYLFKLYQFYGTRQELVNIYVGLTSTNQ